MKLLHSRLDIVTSRKGAEFSDITQTEKILNVLLPADLKQLLSGTDGVDGGCGEWGFVIFSVSELAEIHKQQVSESSDYLPKGVIQFGSDGGGEIFLVDLRSSQAFYGFTSGVEAMDNFIKLGCSLDEFIENYYWTSIKGFEFARSLPYNE